MSGMRQHPRGSIYVLVLSMSLLVAVIGMGALYSARVQTRISRNDVDFATARLNARAGLEVAMFRIQQDSNWRADLGNGTWFSNVSLNQGTFTVSAADPITGNITTPSNDPVVLTSTGTKGNASYIMQVEVQVNSGGLTCLDVASCSGGNTSLSSCTLNCNQTVSSNGSISNSGTSVINGAVQAVGTIPSGITYNGTKSTLSTALGLPDPVNVFDYYNTNGTTIPLTSIYQSNATQIVSNTSFETNTAGWYVYSGSTSATLSLTTSEHQDGTHSLQIANRASTSDVPATDLPLLSIRNGDTYAVKLPTYGSALLGLGSVAATIVLQTSNGTVSFSTSSVSFPLLGSGWVIPEGNLTLSWTGTLTKATLTITCTTSSGTLDIDAVSLTDTTLPASAYVMDRVLLSPASNPYGTPNTSGIYIINCNSQNVQIGPCRIVGTLVLLSPGSGTTIQGPITWETATAGYPALLTNGPIAMSFSSSVKLGEASYGINFNPSGTPYPYVNGTSDTNASDAFPSIINGLIYVGGNLTLSANTSPAFNGCVVSSGQIIYNCTSANLTYGDASYLAPPPGFSTGSASLYPMLGTWQRGTQ